MYGLWWDFTFEFKIFYMFPKKNMHRAKEEVCTSAVTSAKAKFSSNISLETSAVHEH